MTGRHLLVVGGAQDEREALATTRQQAARAAATVVIPGEALPFRRPERANLPVARPRVFRFDQLELAFPNTQLAVRLVLTQPAYLVQTWLDVLDPVDRIIATADREALEQVAPGANGLWKDFEVLDLGVSHPTPYKEKSSATLISETERLLVEAFRSASSHDRLKLCRDADRRERSAVTLLALSSAYRELNELAHARKALDQAIEGAPQWAAVHFENGKFWLATEEMEQARAAFQCACDLMPSFSAAHSNLGATLGELDQPEAAIRAFERALAWDPDGFTILNNIGVVNRELGRLQESEEALRRVVSIAPDFVFGHYNLGHTLLLRRDYAAAIAAYEEGQRRDPEKSRRQGCRLAVARFANGDPAGAERDLWRFVDQAPAAEREELLLEAYEVAHALTRDRPEFAAHGAFLNRIAAELNR